MENGNPNEHPWSENFRINKDSLPRPLLVEALKEVQNKQAALDLGAGALFDSKYLAENGFKQVVAVDLFPAPEDIVESLPPQVEYVLQSFEQYGYPENHFDLVTAQFSLPYNPPELFNLVLDKVKRSLKPGGIFAGHLFGVHDYRNEADVGMTFHTADEARHLFLDMECIKITEEDADTKAASGQVRHFHRFNIIARKLEKLKNS